jgi:Holliday junction resolvase RusA-like endonuclease
MMNLTIPFEVTPASRPKVTRYGTFYSKNYEAFRKVVGEWLDKQEKPNKIIDKTKPIKATFKFTLTIPKSYSKKKREALLGKPMINKKDLDNMIKSCCDILQGRYFEDDSQIHHITANKEWGEKGTIKINIEEQEW